MQISLSAQNVDEIVELIRKNKSIYKTQKYVIKDSANYLGALLQLSDYLHDKNSNVRFYVFRTIHKIGQNTNSLDIRKKCTQLLAIGLSDEDSGIVGKVINYLNEYPEETFLESTLSSIETIVRSKTPHYDKLILLAGKLNLMNLKDDFELMILESHRHSKKELWAVNLALAKMGDEEREKYVIKKVSSLPINDALISHVFPDLIYLKSEKSLNLMLKVVLSDSKDCSSVMPDSDEKLICAFRIIEMLAPVLPEMPVVVDEFGEIETNNPDGLLEKVRQWIQSERELE